MVLHTGAPFGTPAVSFYLFSEAYAMIRSRISSANVMITPPASVRNPFALWLGSWLFKDSPTCTTPNPSKIKPIARIREKIKVDRLLITDNGSPAANAVVAPTVTVSTSLFLISLPYYIYSSIYFCTFAGGNAGLLGTCHG